MPYKSLAQEGYFHTHKAQLEKEGLNVGEWDKATKGKKLPMKTKKSVDKSSKTKLSAMDTKIVHLKSINSKLDVCFDYGDDTDPTKRNLLGTAGLVGVGAGGVLGHQAINRTGGYGANMSAMKYGSDALGKATGNVASNSGKIGAAMNPAYKTGQGLLQSILSKLKPAAKALSSKEKEVQFAGLTADTSGEYKSKLPKIAAGGVVLGGLGYGGYQANKLVKLVGGYRKVGGDLKNAVKRGFKLSRQEQLIELNSKLSDVVEFVDYESAELNKHVTKERKQNRALFIGLPDDWKRHGALDIRDNPRHPVLGKPTLTYKRFKSPRDPGDNALDVVTHPDNKGVTVYDDESASRTRRAKAISAVAVAGGLGYAAGRLRKFSLDLNDLIEFKYPIEIKEKNKGKFDATKKKTGESTEELEHSKNPKTRKRAVFAANAAKWNKK